MPCRADAAFMRAALSASASAVGPCTRARGDSGGASAVAAEAVPRTAGAPPLGLAASIGRTTRRRAPPNAADPGW
eukprot:scaffold119583_cov27-Phaeocystis_antarctica.AAC.1